MAAYNSLRDTLDKMTVFNAEDLTTGILFGTQAALRVDSDLSRVITSRFFGVGSFQSLEAIGISLDDKGKMSLDESKLSAAFAKDPDALKKLFTDETMGVAAKLDDGDRATGRRRRFAALVAERCADRDHRREQQAHRRYDGSARTVSASVLLTRVLRIGIDGRQAAGQSYGARRRCRSFRR